MGQIFSFFRSIGQRCGSSSDQVETESVTTETTALTVGSSPRDTQVSSIAASTADAVVMDTVTECEQTDQDIEELSDTDNWFETDPGNTDTDEHSKLTDRKIEDLAQIIVSKHMATIAIKYLRLPYETVENLRSIRQNDYVAFNRDLLVLWRNKNPGMNQIQRLADILYAAAEEGGCVDPHKIEQLLRIPNPKTSATASLDMTNTITETEFLVIAEKLKPHMERRMKIEPFPWLRDYYVDMNKLYTELILEKIENELLGEKIVLLQCYEEMFNFNGRHKILIKADPGMGKTTLGKKVGWDWARGEFKMFSLVFFIFLKFVQPGESIENAIIKQNPELEGLGVSPQKLRSLLERFGDRCLLILDGLDEHGLGKNIDVVKIIRKQKLLDCGVIVSSRPHSTRAIELHFPVVVGVEGFNRNQAERFASNFFKDENQIEQVLEFSPSDSREQFPIQRCPILLSFFCFLVVEQEINLSDETITMGDIYTRLVKCLYKKFTIRKRIAYKADNFKKVMKSVGQLALQTLMSNNPLLTRREVLRVVGEFAFDYGLFAGHEDIRLLGDPTADIYVTYAHRSLEEFFGSFGFLQALDDGKSVDDILGSNCEKPIFMVNPLVWRFCLWLLSSSDFDLPHRDECYDTLTSFVAKRIDSKVLDPYEIRRRYYAIVILEHSTTQFFHDTLNKCKHVTILCMKNYSEDFSHIVGLMNRDFFNRLKKIIIGDDTFKLKETDSNSLTLSIDADYGYGAIKMRKLLLNKHGLSQRNPQIYLHITKGVMSDITTLLSKYSKELHIDNDDRDLGLLTASGEFLDCPILRYLTFKRLHIDESVLSAMRTAIHNGMLPSLRGITLVKCCKQTLSFDWPNEIEVSVKYDMHTGVDLECWICSYGIKF